MQMPSKWMRYLINFVPNGSHVMSCTLTPAWLKNHYYQEIGVDACDFEWDFDNYPDPRSFFQKMDQKGFNTSLWMNPYIPEGHPTYEEAKAHDYMLKTENGEVARLEFGEPVGVTDFTNQEAKEWWKAKLVELLEAGASAIKVDYGDRVSEDSIASNGMSGVGYHNLHLHLYSETCFEAVKEVYGVGVVWRRSGYIGSQRFPGTWAGDTQVSWKRFDAACAAVSMRASAEKLSGQATSAGLLGRSHPMSFTFVGCSSGSSSGLTRFHGTTPESLALWPRGFGHHPRLCQLALFAHSIP